MNRYLLCLFSLLFYWSSSAQATTDTLLVAYAPAPPFVIEEDGKVEGISVWLWEHCAKELGIHYRYIPMSFGEMLEAVQAGAIDVSINPITISNQRMENMRFTHAFFASHSIVAKGHISAFQHVISFLSSLFSLNFLSGFLALMILIGIFGFLEWFFERKVNPQHFRTGWRGVWDGLWWSVVTMTTVGYGDKTPLSRGGKIVALIWMFSGLLFISGITASIASSLTVNHLMGNTSEIIDFKNRPIGTIAHSSSEQYLKDHFFRQIKLFPNVPTGLDALVDQQVEAFIYDEPIVRYRLKHNPRYADLIVLPNKLRAEFYGFALPKSHAALSDQISQKMLEIIERNNWLEVLNEYGCGEL